MSEVTRNVGSDWTDTSPTDFNYNIWDDDLPEELLGDMQHLSKPPIEMEINPTPEGWTFTSDVDKLPQHSDIISVQFTPEGLNSLITSLKKHTLRGCDTYEEQGECRNVVDMLDSVLCKYASIRPWTPFLKQWLTKIDKYEVRKKAEDQ